MHFTYSSYLTFLTIFLFACVSSSDVRLHHYSQEQEHENNQYFTQDAYGQYSYGYNGPHSTKQESRTIDGVTRGSYSYLDATGKWQTVEYIADANGFRAVGTNLPQNDLKAPQPVTETIEVAEARSRHLAAHERIKLYGHEALSSPSFPSSPLLKSKQLEKTYSAYVLNKAASLPQLTQDTVEVTAAKKEFFKRYEQDRERQKSIQLILSSPLAI